MLTNGITLGASGVYTTRNNATWQEICDAGMGYNRLYDRVTNCEKDSDSIWDAIDSLKSRVSKLE